MTTTLPDHQSKPNSLDTLLKQQLEQRPGLPLLIVKKGIAATPAFKAAIDALLEQIQAKTREPVVLTALSNAAVEFNPWSGLASDSDHASDPSLLEGLVSLLAPGEIIEWHTWPEHCVYLSAAAVEALAGANISPANAMYRLQQAGGRLLISDTLFLHDASSDLFDEDVLQPHEQKQPPGWGLLRERLDAWLKLPSPDSGSFLAQSVADFRSGGKPATLHITHSWGGGIAKWVESFIEADDQGINFQLRSEGPQTGKGYGQRLSLYLGSQLDAPVASWWLQPAIVSTESAHPQYIQVLEEIAERYGISRLIVSSLVGHSLDALRMKLPTLQVLHDFYPLWPLLGINPLPYLGDGPENCLEAAMRENTLLPGLRERNAESWKALARQWRDCVVKQGVQVVAPSHSVARLMVQLDPAWSATDIRIVPHGLPGLPGDAEILPRDREDGRLRLVIPGRIQEGKGQRLLMEALPELDDIAQVYLLGSGKEGELFFGKSGVNVVIQYAREDLRELLASIGPHVAGLLSVVPETFSYTLSEMQQLGIPVIATRVGSLEERVNHGETGWLIEPNPSSLVEQLRKLATDRDQISSVRQRLETLQQADLPEMVAQYRAICSPGTAGRFLARLQSLEATQIASLAFENTELQAKNTLLNEQAKDLQTEIEKRTAWADDLEKARKDEVKRRIEWVAALESQIDEMQGNLDHEQAAHRQTNLHLEKLRSVHQWVLNTASWRFTKPFRVLGRMVGNLGRARAWNPLRWPLLLSQVVRTLGTQGLRGALDRSQATQVKHGKTETKEPVPVDTIGDPGPPSEFPVVEDPDVSIIIPVYNKWAYTAACLRSLAETPCDSSFEVIVVDDQSSDETSGYLAGIEGLVNLRNEENMGFVRSCNRGAAEARGRYIVMLNNDTQVLEGWLDELLDTFRHHPDTGIAGASLVYPDGKLQEAGGIIFNDGSGWNYGKGDDQERPDYQYTREVDYCSGACIMLETGLFRELGGFDMHYAPAYYEDTDLAFRVRAKGLKVRVQPSAVIVHHEGITSGTDLNEGPKSYQVVNREKFLERWLDELSFYPDPIHDPEDASEIRRARDHRLKGRVLIVDAYTPEPDQDSGSVRLGYLMNCLVHLGYGVTFLPDNRAHAGHYTTSLQKAGIEVVYDPWIDSLPRFFSERGGEFDFVMVSRHYVATNYISLVRRHCPKAKFIFDTVDLHYLREERMAELEESLPLKRSAALTKRSELAVINAADATLVVSPVEKTVLGETTPEAKVHVVSNIHEVVGCQRTFAQRKDIFFVGGYQHPPNVDAAEWFVNKIWPLIHNELPEMEFHLIGSKAPEQVRALHGNGVRFHGFVKTLEPWLDGCRLAVAPLRYGAGIKGKVNMSMSRGQPVVATPMAVEGMFAQSGRDVLVADSAEEFAAEVIRLYQDEDLWNRVSMAGLENVRQYFSLETARLSLQALLNSLH